MPPFLGYCYLLVFISFNGWIDPFPTETERAGEVAKVLLTQASEPQSLQSDNSPYFLVKVTEQLAISGLRHQL